ncbi:MAG: nucleotidyl transferase AbiEii/AbiGii toxin family protein [Nanoarchaeota archaeon]|nr:nucleotidyl transferase AbiEii/AbiGii toxin family protein [Nanoarchaeota archaeon]
MINSESFSKKWIESFRKQKQHEKIDPGHLEKMIHALALVEYLSLEGFDFVFKGGTCLVLIMNAASRFSIDVDITTNISKELLEKHLDNIVTKSHFIKWEIDAERSFNNNIPKAHYYFSFNSNYAKEATYILLDVIFDVDPYCETKKVKIESRWIRTEESIQTVKAPSVDAILGDKLTAFAPNTIGVPYNKNKDIEIIKQLFDVYHLIEQVSILEDVLKNFEIISNKQITYQGKEINQQQVLKDIIETAMLLARREKNKGNDKIKFDELQGGIKKFKNQFNDREF